MKLKNKQEWLDNIPVRIQYFIDILPPNIAAKCDYSINSLNELENYLINTYTVEKVIEDDYLLECFATYFGEAYIKIIHNATWKLETDAKDVNYNKMYFCVPNTIAWGEPRYAIIVALRRKTGSYLQSFIEDGLSYSNSVNIVKDVTMISKCGTFYTNFILPLAQEEGFLERIKTQLSVRYQLEDSGLHFIIKIKDYCFYFSFIQEDWVIEESKDIAQNVGSHRADKQLIANCKSRIEVSADDDFDMDYFNDFMMLMEVISEKEKVVIFDYESGTFFDE